MGVRENWDLVDLEFPEMPGLCLAVEETPGGKRCPCISSQPHGAVVYAAAWRDRANRVHEWLELWVQDVSSWHLDGEEPLMSVTNPVMDRHWIHFLEAMDLVRPESIIRLGWEVTHPDTLWLTADARSRSKPSKKWSLCKDDAFLRGERLATFSETLHRYLWNEDVKDPQLIPLTPRAPEGRLTRKLADVFGDALPINPGGGLMMLRKASALCYDDFVDLLSGVEGKTSYRECLRIPAVGANARLLDRPGFGDSGPDGAVTSLEAQAAAVYALFPIDGRRVVLLGHSLGGPIVARVAAEHPDQVAAVVLLAASLDPALEEINPMQWVGTWAAVRWALPRAIRNANAELIALKPELQALARLLPKITAPVLIVHGTKDDLVPVANVPFMQAGLTGARCVTTELLEGQNHFLPWNSTGVVRQAIAWALGAPC